MTSQEPQGPITDTVREIEDMVKSRVEGEGSRGVDLRESRERVGTAPEELTDGDLMAMRVSAPGLQDEGGAVEGPCQDVRGLGGALVS